jgi:hypothetical protein
MNIEQMSCDVPEVTCSARILASSTAAGAGVEAAGLGRETSGSLMAGAEKEGKLKPVPWGLVLAGAGAAA